MQSAMCDANIKRLMTSFSIEDIIARVDKPRQPHLRVSADVVRPWEMQTTNVMCGLYDQTCWRLTAAAAALTLYQWQAINSVSPLCALYKMTTNNFVGSLDDDRLQGFSTTRV